jgi:PhnB protein
MSPTKLNPYLSFRDNAREAMEFYRSVLGGELTITTFGEFPSGDHEVDPDQVMHSQLDTPGGLTLMGSDTPPGMEHHPGSAYSVSLSGDDEAELHRFWDGLAEGATVTMPLEKAPWGDSFGMLVDKFGVPWMVNIAGQPAS